MPGFKAPVGFSERALRRGLRGALGSLAILACVTLVLAGCAGLASSTGPGSHTPPPGTVSVTVSPSSISVAAGASQQFSTTVTGSSNTAVNWTATGGTISSAGVFKAGTATGSFSVTATSAADATKSATANVTVTATPPPVVSVTVNPTAASVVEGATQQFSAAVTGSSNTAVNWTATGGTISSAGLFKAGNAAGSFSVTATSATDATKSAKANVTVTATPPPPVVSVTVNPTAASVVEGATQQFSAAVTGSSDTAVNWTATGGTINSAGLFKAGNAAGNFSVTATSAADATKSAKASVTVTATPPPPVVSVTVNPTSASVVEAATQQFTATVTGSSNTAVNWTATGGTISSAGLFTAGNTAGSFSVAATSAADASKSAKAAVTITAANPPPGTATSVTKDGITWTFSEAVPVGQFVNGDYYVVGPVTIIAISPQPTTSAPYMNGSVVNLPAANGKSGFDSRLNDGTDESWWFDASLRSYPPISLKPGDALVSSISLATIHSLPEVMRSSSKSASPVRTVSVLTVLGTTPAQDAFRPSYCDRSQAIYHASAVQRDLLPQLAPPNPSGTPSLAAFEALYRRPWIDTNAFLFDAPAEYMPSYGQHLAFADSYAALLLMLNFPADQKVNLTNYFVQYGIDLYGCVQTGYGWPAFGGHRSGRKLPIIFAGLLLNNSNFKNVSTTYPDKFGEDMQTVYVAKIPPVGTYQKAWQGATVVYGGHYGVKSSGVPVSAGLYGPYEQFQPSAWPLLNGTEQLGEAYRRCCTSTSWVGEALSIRLLQGENAWNYPAFFDYVDRWMTEDDTQAVAEIKAQTGKDYSQNWERQGQTRYFLQGNVPQPTFVDDMWKAYR